MTARPNPLGPICSLRQWRFEMKHVAVQAFELDLVNLAF
jgi:hypothetical protein